MHLLALTTLLVLATAAPLPAQPVTDLVPTDGIPMDKGSMMGEMPTVMTSSKDDMDMISGMTARMDKRERRDMMPKAEMMPKEMLVPGMGQGKGKGMKRDVMMEKPRVEMMMEEDGMIGKEKMVGHGMKRNMMNEEMGDMMVAKEDGVMMGTEKVNLMNDVKHAMMRPEMSMGKGVMKDMDMRKRGMVKGNMMMMEKEKEMGMNMDVQKAGEMMD